MTTLLEWQNARQQHIQDHPAKPSSKKVYLSSIKKFCSLDIYRLNDIDAFKHFLHRNHGTPEKPYYYKPTTIVNKIAGALFYLQVDIDNGGFSMDTIDAYQDYFENKKRKLEEFKDTGNLTAREEKNWVSWDIVLAHVGALGKIVKQFGLEKKINWTYQERLDYQRWVVGLLYTELPPIRNAYGDMKVLYHPDLITSGHNALVLTPTENYFVLNKYKTKDKYGTIKTPVPAKLLRVIKHFLEKTNSDYVIPSYRNMNKPIGENGLSKFIVNQVFDIDGKKIGSQMLRKIHDTTANQGAFAKAYKVCRNNASAMNHSVSTMGKSYIKNVCVFCGLPSSSCHCR